MIARRRRRRRQHPTMSGVRGAVAFVDERREVFPQPIDVATALALLRVLGVPAFGGSRVPQPRRSAHNSPRSLGAPLRTSFLPHGPPHTSDPHSAPLAPASGDSHYVVEYTAAQGSRSDGADTARRAATRWTSLAPTSCRAGPGTSSDTLPASPASPATSPVVIVAANQTKMAMPATTIPNTISHSTTGAPPRSAWTPSSPRESASSLSRSRHNCVASRLAAEVHVLAVAAELVDQRHDPIERRGVF